MRLASNKGFSLMELLTVVIIIGIIMALVAYSVSRMLPNMQIAGASQQLLGAVGQARMTAVTKSALVRLELWHNFPASQDSFIVLMKNPQDTIFIGGNWTRVAGAPLNQGVEFVLSQNPSVYEFWRDGSLNAWPNGRPVIKSINRTNPQRTLWVMGATGIAEVR